MSQRPPRKAHQVLSLPVLEEEEAPFGQDVAQEIGFLIELMDLRADEAVLDVASGAGRHSLELARRGFRHVTAVDLSDQLLAIGTRAAADAGVAVEFTKADPRALKVHDAFDAALVIGGGAFGLMESDRENQDILDSVHGALRPGGRIVVSGSSLLWLVRHNKDVSGFDPLTNYLATTENVQVEGGSFEKLPLHERYYVFPGLKRQLEEAGFRNVMGFGAAPGRYSGRAITFDDPELLLYGVKPRT